MLDYKLDGERVQLHYRAGSGDGSVGRVFSRRTEDTTQRFGMALSAALEAAPAHVTSFILDAEAVAVDEAGELLPFQTLTARPRYAASRGGVGQCGVITVASNFQQGQRRERHRSSCWRGERVCI